MTDIGFDSVVTVRLRKIEKERLVSIVEEHPELYVNESHFCRAAIIKQIKNFREVTDDFL